METPEFSDIAELCLMCGLDASRIRASAKSHADIAEQTGLTTRTIGGAAQESGFPAKSGKVYDMLAVLNYLVARGTIKPISDSEARKRKVLLECREKELKISREEKQVIDVAEVQREWTGAVNQLDTQVKRKGQRLAKEFLACESAGEVIKLWEKSWREIRSSVSAMK